MVRLNKIYTRTGDDGTTGLGDGSRRSKYDLRVASYGTVDEANAAVGMARLSTRDDPQFARLDAILARIQNDLFDLGADLCTPDTGVDPGYEPLRIVAAQVTRIEAEIDELNSELAPLKSFILPGGSAAAAHLHLARTIARRAERLMSELAVTEGEQVGEAAMHYVNRLSDLLFVAARHANNRGRDDVLWVPGANR